MANEIVSFACDVTDSKPLTVYKAVSHPGATGYRFLHVGDNLKRTLHAIIFDFTIRNSGVVGLSIESKNIVGVVTC